MVCAEEKTISKCLNCHYEGTGCNSPVTLITGKLFKDCAINNEECDICNVKYTCLNLKAMAMDPRNCG